VRLGDRVRLRSDAPCHLPWRGEAEVVGIAETALGTYLKVLLGDGVTFVHGVCAEWCEVVNYATGEPTYREAMTAFRRARDAN